jgi:serine/threonine-protein kinase
MVSRAMTAELPPVIGGWRVLREISRGGMGVVVLGEKSAHGAVKRAAIKLMRASHEERHERMFLDEMRIASRLSHPNVCQAYDFGEERGTLYLVMEFVDGISASALIEAHIAPGLALRVAQQVARGLEAAHGLVDDEGKPLHIVHRDVTPHNIIVSVDGCAKLLDFGIAKSRDRLSQTQSGTVWGKPGYMAPEQFDGGVVDARTDVFQLGVVLFELLTSRPLFTRATLAESMRAVLDDPIPDPRTHEPSLEQNVVDVVRKALSRRADDRFADAASFARALESTIAGRDDASEELLAREVKRLRASSSTSSSSAAASRVEPEVNASATTTSASVDVVEKEARVTVKMKKPRDAAPATTTTSRATIARSDARRGRNLLAGALAIGALAMVALWLAPSGEREVETGSLPGSGQAAADATADKPPPRYEVVHEVVLDQAQPSMAASARVEPPVRERAHPVKLAEPAPSASTGSDAQNATGAVDVLADVYGDVRVDGSAVGPTPVLALPVREGEHVVEILAPDTGVVRFSERVHVEAGRTTRVLSHGASGFQSGPKPATTKVRDDPSAGAR